jgi:proton-translocating NADH-quinone oxidoreductase chain L
MYLVLVFSPLLGSISGGFFGRYLGSRGAGIITTGSVLLSFICSLFAFYEVALSGNIVSIPLQTWFSCELFDGGWGFYFDTLTVVMAVVVTVVSSLVHFYGFSYMSQDPHIPRFMSYLSIFTFFMLTLITGDNLVQIFFGWEGVGLASYLLINFWFTRLQASKAAIKAMLVNRVGDFGFALGIMALFTVTGTVNLSAAFGLAPFISAGTLPVQAIPFPAVPAVPAVPALLEMEMEMEQLEPLSTLTFCTIELDALTLITLLLFIGAMGKSAQLFLHTWLPDAMEGPTPVSALIHAATMVTAGVFLIARCSPLFEYAPSTLLVVAFLGAMTCFFAGTVGLVQNDIKRVIAYSTCSQLGYMVFACGLSQYSLGVFHLMNHAFFKALLFLSAGCIIHALSDEQDMRRMGGVVQSIPFTYGMTLIGSMSLVGFPFLTGFYSKDSILEVGYATYTLAGNFGYFLTAVSVICTSYYSFRLLFLSYLRESSSFRKSLEKLHDAPPLMALPLLPLALGSLFVGFCAKDMMIGLGTNFWGNALFVLPKNLIQLESEYIPLTQKLSPLLYTIIGFFLAFLLNFRFPFSSYQLSVTPFEKGFGKIHLSFGKIHLSTVVRNLYTFLNRRWFFDKVYNYWLAETLLFFGYHTSWKRLDKGCFEILGPFGVGKSFPLWSQQLGGLQSGMVYHYAVMILLGVTAAIALLFARDLNLLDPFLYLLFPLALVFYIEPVRGFTPSDSIQDV